MIKYHTSKKMKEVVEKIRNQKERICALLTIFVIIKRDKYAKLYGKYKIQAERSKGRSKIYNVLITN